MTHSQSNFHEAAHSIIQQVSCAYISSRAKTALHAECRLRVIRLRYNIRVNHFRPTPISRHSRYQSTSLRSTNSGSRSVHSITPSTRAASRSITTENPTGRSTSWAGVTSVAGAILINAPTLERRYLLQGKAVAISRTTGVYALPFSGLSRSKGERGAIGVTRTECSRT